MDVILNKNFNKLCIFIKKLEGYWVFSYTHTHTHHVFDGFKPYKVVKILDCYIFLPSSSHKF